MSPLSHYLSRIAVFSGCALLFAASTADAARPGKKSRNADGDSAPVLMSRTGGGDIWADVKELTAAAEKGNPKAEAQLGEMLLRGDPEYDVPEDRTRALRLLESAARKGEASAAFRLGMVLDEGMGVEQDRGRAHAYFRAAAAGGVAEAFHNIGAAYASARGVKRDYAEGLAWLILAGKNGSESPAESALREHLNNLRRSEIASLAEKRAVEIERELAEKEVVDLLPPPAETFTTNAPSKKRG
jgi:uncharacterized protein